MGATILRQLSSTLSECLPRLEQDQLMNAAHSTIISGVHPRQITPLTPRRYLDERISSQLRVRRIEAIFCFETNGADLFLESSHLMCLLTHPN